MNKKSILIADDIHFGPIPQDKWDQSRVNIFFSKTPSKRPINEVMLGTNGASKIIPPLVIPPGKITQHTSFLRIPEDISVLTINPHMHLLGKSFKAYVITPAQDTIRLISIPRWDFRWQYFYTFPKMLKIPAGSVIYVEAEFDNTAENQNNPYNPPQEIRERYEFGGAGMRTTDEMLQFIITWLPYQVGDEDVSLEVEQVNWNYPYPGYEPEPTRLSYSLILPAITIGYRYQKPDGHLVFRTGIASPDGEYLALGAAFQLFANRAYLNIPFQYPLSPQMHITKEDVKAMDRIDRLNLINSLSGIKPVNLIGSVDADGNENLAIFSSVMHLGSNPALFGFILRPQGDARRHTYENLQATGEYTINFVHTTFMRQAHYTSIKAEAGVSEFDLSGLTPEHAADFKAPFVKESTIKLGMSFQQEIPIELNGTSLIIGQVEHIILPDGAMDDGGHFDLGAHNVAGLSGLNTYYSLNKEARFPYVRDEYTLKDL